MALPLSFLGSFAGTTLTVYYVTTGRTRYGTSTRLRSFDGPPASKRCPCTRTRRHTAGAILTVTQEGDLVLGLELDDPDNDPATVSEAADLMALLTAEFGAPGGVAGVELAPPQSVTEWQEDAL